MAIKFKKPKTDGSMLKGIILGTGVALLLTLAGCALSAWGICTQRVAENAVETVAVVTAVVSCGAGAASAAAMSGGKRMQVCLITAAGYYLCLLSVTAMFFGGDYAGAGGIALAVLGAGAVTGILGILPKKQKGTRHTKKAYR